MSSINTAKVDQVPKLYLRGALINITLKNLTKAQNAELDRLIRLWIEAPELSSIRQGFIQQLRNTIGGEYAEPNKAEAEFHIALMKGLCYLKFHRKYSIKCDHCNSKTHNGKKYQRCLAVCPQCNYTRHNGKLVPMKKVRHTPATEYESPFTATPGKRSAEKSDEIMADRGRMVRFLTKISKNYIRQILRENKIARKDIEYPIDRATADYALRSHIEFILAKYGITNNPNVTDTTITIRHNITPLTPIELIQELKSVRLGYAEHGVKSTINDKVIEITVDANLPVVDAMVKKAEVIKMANISHDGDNSNVDSIMYNSDGMVPDSHTLEFEEAIRYIKDNLSGKGREIFEIFIGEGAAWEKFQRHYGGQEKPHLNKISELLGCNTNQVKSSLHLIRQLCVEAGMVPQE